MKLNTRAFALAAGLTAAALFVVCALFVAIAPSAATALFSNVLHLDLTGLARPLTLGSFVGGLIFWGLGTTLVFGVAAVLYNWLSGGEAARPASIRAAEQRG